MVHLTHLRRDLKDWNRLREIVTAFAMGGFSYYIKQTKLHGCVSIKCKIKCIIKRECHCGAGKHSMPIHFRKVIESLGPTFIKFGQILSLRPDVIPEEYCNELRKLQDEVPSFAYSEVKQIIKDELGQPVNKIFASFDKKPIAAASIAQVHKAKLKNGKTVAVKILRPNVKEIINQDIRILETVAKMLDTHFEASRIFRPIKFIQEFKDWTLREIDFRNEARVMGEMSERFAKSKLVKIPKVFWKQTSAKVLTMEYMQGAHIANIKGLQQRGINRKQLAINGVELCVRQTLVEGVFHGDPHPGNILAIRGNKFVFLDFGIIGRLNERQRRKISRYMIHVFKKDFDRALNIIMDLAEVTDESDLEGFKRKVMDVLSVGYGTLENSSLSEGLFKCVIAGVAHKIYFPSDLVLFSKAFVTTESVCRTIYPQFSVLTDARAPVEKALRRELLPLKPISNLIKNSLDYSEVIEEFPMHISKIVKTLERGQISINFDHTEFPHYFEQLKRANSIVSLGVIIAALIIASGIASFASKNTPQHMLSLPMIELYIAGALGILLLVILRRKTGTH